VNLNLGVNNVETREEFIALFAAIAAATPDDEQREADLFNAFYECADQLLKGLSPEEAHRVISALRGSPPQMAARRPTQAQEDRREPCGDSDR
jgi:hypothetical protein